MDFDLQRTAKVDEDEGSPLQNGANVPITAEQKIEGSAEALRVRHDPSFFPSRSNPNQKHP